MKEVYLVFGDRGSYSDHEDWVVSAHSTEAEANERMQLLTDQYKKFIEEVHGNALAYEKHFKLDENVTGDHADVQYCVCRTTLDEPIANVLKRFKRHEEKRQRELDLMHKINVEREATGCGLAEATRRVKLREKTK